MPEWFWFQFTIFLFCRIKPSLRIAWRESCRAGSFPLLMGCAAHSTKWAVSGSFSLLILCLWALHIYRCIYTLYIYCAYSCFRPIEQEPELLTVYPPPRSTWVRSRFVTCLGGVCVVRVVKLHVITFLVPCCDVRYDFRVKTMFYSSRLALVSPEGVRVLFMLFVFIYFRSTWVHTGLRGILVARSFFFSIVFSLWLDIRFSQVSVFAVWLHAW